MKGAMFDNDRSDTASACPFETVRSRLVRDYDADIGLEVAAIDRVDDRLQIGALARNEDAELNRRSRSFDDGVDAVVIENSGNRNTACAARHFADDVGALLARAQMFNDRIGVIGSGNRDHAEAIVERAIHFGLIDFAEPRDEIEDRRHSPGAAADSRVQVLRHHPRQILDDTAAGDIRQALEREAIEKIKHGLRIDAGRAQQLIAERAAEFRHACAKLEFCAIDQDLAHKRESIGVKAGGGQADNRIADAHFRWIRDSRALGEAHGKASEIVFTGPIEAGHLRRFTADERHLCLRATLRDTLDDGEREALIELPQPM